MEAYELICSHKPEIVITDIRTPGLGGLDIIVRALPLIFVKILSGTFHDYIAFKSKNNHEDTNQALKKAVEALDGDCKAS